MKKLLGIVFLGLLLSGNAYAANEGSGAIEFPPKFEQRFKDYLGHVANKKQYKFAFAFHPDGANDWQAIKGGSSSLKVAEKKAIKACNKKAKKKGCKIFAKGEKIVWNWDSIPSVYFTLIETSGSFDYIDWKDVSIEIGEGPISLSKDVTKKFAEYLEILENNKNEDSFSIYFAISPDGKNSGDMESSSSSSKNIEMVKAMAIAECMSNNKKNKCYLYAINDEVVWK
tara:strand:- start:421 stop:1101 length:681 start_codon:yes stop_codon:yes gene_type:complete